MIKRLYGKIKLSKDRSKWIVEKCEPHVSIKIKNIFPKISRAKGLPYYFDNSPDINADLDWFMKRYPLEISLGDEMVMNSMVSTFENNQVEMEQIFTPKFTPGNYELKEGQAVRHYQSQAVELLKKTKLLLVGDDVGLGKTYVGIAALTDPKLLPAVVVVMTHLQGQWEEKTESFSNLRVHKIKGTRPYTLPESDVYVIKYSCLAGWVPILETGFFKTTIFDEVQELRVWNETHQSQKGIAARVLTANTKYCLGLSASPIYNYGDEIFNVFDMMRHGCLGTRMDFLREWTGRYRNDKHIIQDPKALGSYLRERHLFLRRTREEVGQYLPPVNKIIHTVDYNEKAVKSVEDLARTLAIKVTEGSFVERGKAARQLDIMVRKNTGVSKAKYVADYCKILLENNEPILLAGWHRDVYGIWLKELEDYNPVMYTGSESPAQKEKLKNAFINGESNCMIISLRSGIGLDGLQNRCKIVVIGELDWSPEVHKQLIGRVDREGQEGQVTAIYLVSDSGSDPLMIDLLGLKSSQASGIIDPFSGVSKQYSDTDRIRLLAEKYLTKKSA